MISTGIIASMARPEFWLPLLWTAGMSWLFALLEIQIEGPHGWAANLPTWRLPPTSKLRWLFGGRPITGYHVYAFAFVAAVFHLPLAFLATFALPLEARILAGLALFWLLEDFLWFMLNPAFGLRKFKPAHIPWHPWWLWGAPVDYWIMGIGAVCLYIYSCRAGGAAP